MEPSQKMKTDFSRLMGPFRNFSCVEMIDRYSTLKPDHSYYREATWDKFFAGFGFGYLLLRELPVRNFYARCLIMYVYAGKIFDHFPLLPYSGCEVKVRPKREGGGRVGRVAQLGPQVLQQRVPRDEVREHPHRRKQVAFLTEGCVRASSGTPSSPAISRERYPFFLFRVNN